MEKSTKLTKSGLAEMLKGGVIMDVVDADQARIAEQAGACAVMALERVPAQIRAEGGVARASDPAMIQAIQAAVSIPVMAKCRIGHFMEARILLTARLWKGLTEEGMPVRMVTARTDVDYKVPILFRPEPYDAWSWLTHVGERSPMTSSTCAMRARHAPASHDTVSDSKSKARCSSSLRPR